MESVSNLQLSFEVGHGSIGWGVLERTGAKISEINLLGCGCVVFRADDCLASSRRAYRRQRRHIRSTRQRIARLKTLLASLGVLTGAELDHPGCAWPWKLAAQVVRGGPLLTWAELWDVLRWYAHNRGYDGNRRWSAGGTEAEAEDTEKEANARALMKKHGTKTMAGTFCALSGIDPLGPKKSANLPGDRRPKGQRAAFPRTVVEGEVRQLLQRHFGVLARVDADLLRVLLGRDEHDKLAWQAIPCAGLKLPKRYEGGLLFGQLVPRFDNRIISQCPVSGGKVPARNCPEFLNFRWAMQLAGLRAGKRPDSELRALDAGERGKLDQLIHQRGYFTPGQLKEAVRRVTGCEHENVDTLLLYPEAKNALLVDPVQKLICSEELQPFWKLLPARLQQRLRGQWRRGKVFTLAQIRRQLAPLAETGPFDVEWQKQLAAHTLRVKPPARPLTPDEFLQRRFPARALKLDGRAAFARPLLKQAYADVLAGKPHPKEPGGCLYLGQDVQRPPFHREIAGQTNNHLVRHRLLILERLLADIIKDYAGGQNERIAHVTIEVNRDLREMAGKTSYEKQKDWISRLQNHQEVAGKLEKALAREEKDGAVSITAGLIRKARVAEDLGWRCPYTGVAYEPRDLAAGRVDKDPIIPRSERAADALDALAVTFPAIIKWKGQRTAWQFVAEEQGRPVPGWPDVSILRLPLYQQWVEGLEAFKGHDEDQRRKRKRKELLLLPRYEEREFRSRDLAQTSQLLRLGAQVLRQQLPHLAAGQIISLPGAVTGAVRKAWHVLDCLAAANPQVRDDHAALKSKADIRDITHLYHALDACVLGLAAHFIPPSGRVWELVAKRNLSDLEKQQLEALGVFGAGAENRFELHDLAAPLKDQLRRRLAEKRVVQHIPARMDGLRVEQNTWRVVTMKDGEVVLRQRIRQPDGSRPEKIAEAKPGKLLGLSPAAGTGKLAANKGVLVIPENFGVALDPQPVIIPFHKVWTRLQELKKLNGNKMPRVLRNGQLIRVSGGIFQGVWRVFSAKNNATGIALNIGAPDVVRLKNKTEGHKINVRLASLLAGGLEPVASSLTGVAAAPVV